MPLKKLRCFNTGSIAAGASWTKEFSPPFDWHIKHIFISDRSAKTLTDVLVYIKLGEDLITDDYAPAHLFGSDKLTAIDIDKDVAKGTTIYIKVDNKKSESVDLDICFELTE